jgi:glycosyltransferase involved in cell wall biosynthesis
VPFDEAHPKCNQVEISDTNPPSPVIKSIAGAWTCVKYCREYSPNIVAQFWRYPHHAPAVVVAGHLTNTPTLLRLNGDVFRQHRMYNGLLQYPAAAFNRFSGLAANFASRIIAFGPHGRKELAQHGVNDQKIVTLPPSADIGDQFQPVTDVSTVRAELDLSPDRRIALYVGRIESSKGMRFLREVINETNSESDFQFVLVGPGSGESESVDHEITTQFESDIVRIEGKVPHSNIHKYYQSADVYVHPSPFEGIPLTLIEALKCGLPVVARPAGDIGILTSNLVDDPEDMAKILLKSEWDETWEDKELFSKEYQYSKLNTIIAEIID